MTVQSYIAITSQETGLFHFELEYKRFVSEFLFLTIECRIFQTSSGYVEFGYQAAQRLPKGI